jgi:hypothetical protein
MIQVGSQDGRGDRLGLALPAARQRCHRNPQVFETGDFPEKARKAAGC